MRIVKIICSKRTSRGVFVNDAIFKHRYDWRQAPHRYCQLVDKKVNNSIAKRMMVCRSQITTASMINAYVPNLFTKLIFSLIHLSYRENKCHRLVLLPPCVAWLNTLAILTTPILNENQWRNNDPSRWAIVMGVKPLKTIGRITLEFNIVLSVWTGSARKYQPSIVTSRRLHALTHRPMRDLNEILENSQPQPPSQERILSQRARNFCDKVLSNFHLCPR